MSYFDRQKRKMLYEQKLKSDKNIIKEEILKSKKDSSVCYKKDQIVSYKDDEYKVKYCADGNCVIEKDENQIFVPCSDVTLVKDKTLDEAVFQVTYSTDGVNYYSNVLVRAENAEQAEKIAVDKAKVKPHADSKIIVTERDEAFVNDYHYKRGMNLIESTTHNPSLGVSAVDAVKSALTVGLNLASMENISLTMHDFTTLIESLIQLRDSIVDKKDYKLQEDYVGDMPNAPDTEVKSGVATLINSLIADELEAIDGYNGAIQTLRYQNQDGNLDGTTTNTIIEILTNIAGEENIHIGQLQKAQELVNPQVELIKEGEKEAEEVIVSDS